MKRLLVYHAKEGSVADRYVIKDTSNKCKNVVVDNDDDDEDDDIEDIVDCNDENDTININCQSEL